MRTRFAPTPSGYLHSGNLVNAALVAMVASEIGADVFLRIDDIDAQRTRIDYVEDIFRAVSWLALPVDIGPRTMADLDQWSQTTRIDLYWETLCNLANSGAPLFVCSCSRTEVVDGRCIQGCSGTLGDFERSAETHAVRMRANSEDVVLWGRFGPAYHLASVSDDIAYGITHVVRGKDLEPSTALHRQLNEILGAPTVRYAHHDLVVSSDGSKLSKSHGTTRLEFTQALGENVSKTATSLLPSVLAQLT